MALTAQVSEALQPIHAAGVIHRDLKPSDILLSADGPKVIDFGNARAADVTSVTSTGMLAGTPGYMAPECIRGESLTEAVDVFALGAIAAYAATARPAFGGTGHSVLYRILEQAPDLDGCPEPVRTVAARCLAKDPAKRPGLAEVIRLCRTDGPTGRPPPYRRSGPSSTPHRTSTTPSPRPRRRRDGIPGPGKGVRRSRGTPPPGPDPARPAPLTDIPAMSVPALVGGIGVLAVVAVLVTVLMPGNSSDHNTPTELKPAATLGGYPRGKAPQLGGLGAVIADGDGKVLLLHRTADDYLGGLWELPAGGIDDGENLTEALRREVAEETGLPVAAVGDYLGHFDYRSAGGRATHQFNFTATVTEADKTVKLTEHDAYLWADRSEQDRVSSATQAVLDTWRNRATRPARNPAPPPPCTASSSPAADRSTAAKVPPQSRPSARPAASTRTESAPSRHDHDRSQPQRLYRCSPGPSFTASTHPGRRCPAPASRPGRAGAGRRRRRRAGVRIRSRSDQSVTGRHSASRATMSHQARCACRGW
ncbi:NUDIX domain-containing protein [Streptomyces sp. NPDC056255]|uniref:protein kinase domain-containing protein n=1 Tax=Streptomyces sp. NPDC056255 TaxID=3345764 RepID=UPI0035DC39B0